MAVVLERRSKPRKLGVDWSANRVDIGLVNNVPDGALEATERQFAALLDEAAQDVRVQIHLHLFTLPEIRRGACAASRVEATYRPSDMLFRTPLDALIVTGTEPQADDLHDEPYWPTLTRIVDWAQDNTVSTIFSCLAAHAAVLHLDGVDRHPFPRKLVGVFDEERVGEHALTAGLPDLPAPHSRWNELREDELAAKGYSILTRSDESGVGLFAKKCGSQFVFIQGHPEYDPESLLREYRRDIGRYLRSERAAYPASPRHYFDAASREAAAAFRARAIVCRDPGILSEFSVVAPRRDPRLSWHPGAVALYRNWLRVVTNGKPLRLAENILRHAGAGIR
jgi:homoserine O-succinyltransferase